MKKLKPAQSATKFEINANADRAARLATNSQDLDFGRRCRQESTVS